ncbi:T9SS type A sorting domain-containing protein [Pontibacter lucknowensis]|uniref:Por secretion system C-terminal sorting domain-containing protein n=1 Tax=Pontibacter lucknowensis TaxID=1077936 RepID=A0A1N6YGG1_9BACT|nr:T9SS type A sorting domain-containing protein [Pontibacter lucknowensis]SIR13630.1 Por secretion system C-terminal sorting domain-containing protein [Pontibacter lucknowensis]
MIRTLTLFVLLISAYPSFAQFNSVTTLSQIPITTNTGEKPQSKVWVHANKFWTVLPDSEGTHVWRLDGTVWVKDLKISDKTTSKVDCKVVGDVTHVLLFQGVNSELVSIEYVPNRETYGLWSERNEATTITLGQHVEIATLEVDSRGRMWIASASESSTSEEDNDIFVQWSDSPYYVWSDPITLATRVNWDDICVVIALPGKVGVFWSNQNTTKFGFRTHDDRDTPDAWSEIEDVVHNTNGNTSGGLADDHMNMAIASDGTLYCAIKTSYKNSNQPLLGLFVRRPTGTWDNLYSITKAGSRTRPIVILNEVEKIIRVIYTDNESGGNIVYKESPLDVINFPEDFNETINRSNGQASNREHILIEGFYNNVTSTKDNFTDKIVVMASTSRNAPAPYYAVSVLATSEIIPLPVELVSFTARLSADDAVLEWRTASEQDNDHFSVESSTDGRTFTPVGKVTGNGTTQLQRHYSFTDKNISRYRAEGVYYRLRQVDYSGEFEFSPIRYVRAPGLPDAITLRAFPSPFDSYLQVQVASNEEQGSTIILYNAQGRVIQSQAITLKRGINTISLTELDLASGIYLLKVTTGDQQQVLKLVSE